MFKKIAMIALCVSLTAPAITQETSAKSLTDAFNSLLVPGAAGAVTAPGRYQSGARNSFVAGGLEMRFPRTNTTPQLFSFSPPRVSAGCNGVSAHFGGFSFISGKEFEQMVKGIASGAALGFVTMMGIKSLCPICADVIQQLKNAAQLASRLAIDSCKVGQELFKKFNGEQSDFTTTLCGSTTSESGGSNDFLAAISNTCNSIAGALDGLKDANDIDESTPEGKAKMGELMCRAGVGNVTWATLGGVGLNYTSTGGDESYARKIILMNMMGATLFHSGDTVASCETATGVKQTEEGTRETIYCPPTVGAKDINGLFMCGSDVGRITALKNPTINSYCSQFFTKLPSTGGSASSAGISKLMVCEDEETNQCRTLVLKDAHEIASMSGEGFLPRVSRLMQEGVNAVRDNKEMPADVLELMATAPFPLYQAINAAAVYPVAAADLLDSISVLVAESATGAMMNEFLRWHGREGSHSCSSEEQVKRVLETIESARSSNNSMKTLISQNMVAQNAIKEQIRTLNLAVQQQVMTTDLLQQNQMAQTIARSVTSNSKLRSEERRLPANN